MSVICPNEEIEYVFVYNWRDLVPNKLTLSVDTENFGDTVSRKSEILLRSLFGNRFRHLKDFQNAWVFT